VLRHDGTAVSALQSVTGHVLSVDGGLWVDSYQALIKLE